MVSEAEEVDVESAILDAAHEAGASRLEVILRLVDRSQVDTDQDGLLVGAKRAVYSLKATHPGLFLRGHEAASLTHMERAALKAGDDIATLEASLRSFLHRLRPGVDLTRLAVQMNDLATLSPAERSAIIARRLEPPSPWLAEWGPAGANEPRPEPSISRLKPPSRKRPEYLQQQDKTGGDLVDLDQYNPFVEAAKQGSRYGM